jgi:hypothetical protein
VSKATKLSVEESLTDGVKYSVFRDGSGVQWWFSNDRDHSPDYRLSDAPFGEGTDTIYLPLSVIETLYRLTRPRPKRKKPVAKKKGVARGKVRGK